MNRDQAHNDGRYYCQKLISSLERDKETIRGCLSGEPMQLYLEATDEAIKKISAIRRSLRMLQDRTL